MESESNLSSVTDLDASQVTPSEIQKKWYILKAAGGFERKVTIWLKERLRHNNMEHLVEEVFIPAEEVIIKKHGKESKKTITYYPGYVIIKMDLTNELWHLLREVPKVSGFVGGTPQKPLPITEQELQEIKSQISSGMKQAELNSTFQIGQSVRIIEGPFAEFNGEIDMVDLDRNKLSVKVSIFGRATPIELDFDKVKTN